MKQIIFSALLVASFSFAGRAQTAQTAPTTTTGTAAKTCTFAERANCTKGSAACCSKMHSSANGTAMAKVDKADKAVKKEDPKQK
jgi:hypothetical protein